MLYVDIKKDFGAFKLDVSFEAERETLALLGASGCGKSMTLKCIAGIVTPDGGRIVLGDRVLFDSAKKIDLSSQKRRVGYLFQQYALFPNMTVLQNVAAGVRDADKKRKNEKAAAMLRTLQLDGLEKKRPHQLSGGQQQRVALARILVNEPELLLLDEPFTALDSYLKWQLELELSDILTAFGGTTVFVSHSRDEVYRLCDSVCVLSYGKSEAKQPVKELFERPATLAACLLSGCKNYSRVRPIGGSSVEAIDWGVTLTARDVPAEAAMLGVRAHFIRLSREENGENSFLCQVERVVEDVFTTVVMLKIPGGKGVYARIRAELSKEAWAALELPSQLWVSIAPEDIMLLRESHFDERPVQGNR